MKPPCTGLENVQLQDTNSALPIGLNVRRWSPTHFTYYVVTFVQLLQYHLELCQITSIFGIRQFHKFFCFMEKTSPFLFYIRQMFPRVHQIPFQIYSAILIYSITQQLFIISLPLKQTLNNVVSDFKPAVFLLLMFPSKL